MARKNAAGKPVRTMADATGGIETGRERYGFTQDHGGEKHQNIRDEGNVITSKQDWKR